MPRAHIRSGTKKDVAKSPAGSSSSGASRVAPAYGIGFVDQGMGAAASRQEAAFDLPERDKLKSEVGISWASPTYTRNAVQHTTPGRSGRAKRQAVTWTGATYSSHTANQSSTTVEKPFTVTYTKVVKNNNRRLKVAGISGGATVKVYTGGSRNAISSPPTSEGQAEEAVTNMKAYYNRGSRGDWHTEAASKSHELYHYREWKESCNHYWPTCRTAIEALSIPVATSGSEATIESQANALVDGFKSKSWDYWMTLGDGAGDRPYAAGQLTLNRAVESVQKLAGRKSWTVTQGVDTPSTANPTYQPWLPYNP